MRYRIFKRVGGTLAMLVILTGATLSIQAQTKEVKTKSDGIKITLLSIGSGSTRITYEHAFNKRNSIENTIGIIGLGWDIMNGSRSNGLLYKGAFKWRLTGINEEGNLLNGMYVKPEVVIAHYDYRDKGEDESERKITFQGALMAEIGYQWLWSWFLLDIYSGLGFSVGNGNDNNYFHSFMLFPKESPMAFTAGFRVGIAL